MATRLDSSITGSSKGRLLSSVNLARLFDYFDRNGEFGSHEVLQEFYSAGDGEHGSHEVEFYSALVDYENHEIIHPGTAPPDVIEKVTKLAKQVLDRHWEDWSYAYHPSFALKKVAEVAKEFLRRQEEPELKFLFGDPSNFREYLSYVKNGDASQPSTKPFPSWCPSNVSSFKADDEVDNHGDALPMPNVRSRASVFAPDWSSPYSTMLPDMPSVPHFVQPGTSNVRGTRSGKLDDASASEASNEANARFEMHDDSDSEASNGQAIAGSEIHNRDIDNDHSAWTEIIRACEAKFLIEFNAVIAAVTGGAVFNLIGSTSTDSPFLRCSAATAGIGFFGSSFAICFTRNPKVAKVLSKIGAIGAVSAVSIGLGITVLKDTEWYVNLVATGIACLLSSGVIAMADI